MVAISAAGGILAAACGTKHNGRTGIIPGNGRKMVRHQACPALTESVPGLQVHRKGPGTAAAGGGIAVVEFKERNKEKVKIIIKPTHMENRGFAASRADHRAGGS